MNTWRERREYHNKAEEKHLADLQEYEDIKNDTIKKYGIEGKDGNYSININSDSFKDFLNDMKQYDNIQSEVNLVMLKPEDLYSSALNAQDILSISFMIDEEKDNGTE